MSKALEILLVEDSLSDRLLALDALSEVNTINNVHVVEDGIEALDFLRHAGKYSQTPDPDLILLDLNLPHAKMEERSWRNLKLIRFYARSRWLSSLLQAIPEPAAPTPNTPRVFLLSPSILNSLARL